MPGLNGYDVCRELKSDPSTHDMPIIFLTSLTEEAEEYKGLRWLADSGDHRTMLPSR